MWDRGPNDSAIAETALGRGDKMLSVINRLSVMLRFRPRRSDRRKGRGESVCVVDGG